MEWGGIVTKTEIAQSVRISHWNKVIIFYGDDIMTTQQRIDEMYRQLETTKPTSKQKIRDLKRGIERAKRKKRRELRGGTIII